MAWRSAGSAARSFVSATARAPSLRSPPATLPRLRPTQSSLPRRRFASFTNPRNLGELGCTQSLLPLHNVVASARLISHLNLNVRAFCELPNGTFQRTCPDR
ncbi:unnamed protein product [Eruca vesicaria subsp. sativa]|uniref:Uncharacterized protein n=1 Tax=Eruca vesicaria subsp. sativa TaxID=29727 RepID=A0ABC8LAK2_ERUVS|nr:unnamed protein product [Eruca vesicaria subsp. sativa]